MKLNKINLSGVSYDLQDYETSQALSGKQDTLISGSNIKTVNNQSLLGEGNIEIQGGGATYSAGTNISIDANNAINCTLPISVYNETKGSLILGNGGYNTSNNYYTIVGGSRNNANGNTSFAVGKFNNTNNDYEVALGCYNKSNTGSTDDLKTLFSIGNGSSNKNRHNAFEIRKNGDIYISKDGVDVKLQDQLGGGSVDVDTELDDTSENPVQNKVIYQKFDEVEEVTAAALNALNDKIGDINTLLEGI